MTQKEMTEAAILKAKADKIKVPKDQQNIDNIKEVQTISAIDTVDLDKIKKTKALEKPKPKTKQVDIKKYPYEVQLGKEKIVRYRPWTGKTKKKFRKLFQGIQDMNELDFTEVVNVIIRDHIDAKDIYLSDHEQQYLTALLRKISIEDTFEFDAKCEHCSTEQHIKTSVSESVKFKMNDYPSENKEIKTKYIDIGSNGFLLHTVSEILESQDYDGLTTAADIELALHLQFEDTSSPLEILDKLDDMELKPLEIILNDIEKYSAEMTMKIEKACSNCAKSSVFISEEIPGLFESLLS